MSFFFFFFYQGGEIGFVFSFRLCTIDCISDFISGVDTLAGRCSAWKM